MSHYTVTIPGSWDGLAESHERVTDLLSTPLYADVEVDQIDTVDGPSLKVRVRVATWQNYAFAVLVDVLFQEGLNFTVEHHS
jgi:hypothetical protein